MRQFFARFGFAAAFGIGALVAPELFAGPENAWIWKTLLSLAILSAALGSLSYWERGWNAAFPFVLRWRSEPDWEWLKAVAVKDDIEMASRIRCTAVTMRSGLRQIEPFVLFEIHVYNASIFPIRVDSVAGPPAIASSPLSAPPMLVKPGVTIERGATANVGLRVFVPNSQINNLANGSVHVSLGKLGLMFRYEFQGQHRIVRLGFPSGSYERFGNWP